MRISINWSNLESNSHCNEGSPEVNVRDVMQFHPLQNVFEGLEVDLVLDLRLDHPDPEAKTNHVNVGL